MMRWLLPLHAMAPAAIVAAMLLHWCQPPGLAHLAERPAWPTWALIAAWLALSAATARLPARTLWRVALWATAAPLALAGALALPRSPAMAAALALLGLACAAAGCARGAPWVQPGRAHPCARPSAHAAAATTDTGMGGCVGRCVGEKHGAWRKAWRGLRHGAGRLAGGLARHAPFLLAAALAAESFRLAHIVAREPARSSGMLGLLLAFFAVLPAATLRHWLPRTAGALWCAAALAYAALGAKAALAQWPVAGALCALAGGACLGAHWRRRRQAAQARPPVRGTPVELA